MKNLVKLGVISVVLVGNSLIAKDNCEVSLATSSYINANAMNISKTIGLYDKIERKYDCEIKISYFPDYLKSVDNYKAKKYDAIAIKNLEYMTEIHQEESLGIVIQGYSNGNDGLISRNGKSLKDLKGQEIWMVEKSTSELLFIEAAKKEGLDPYKDFIVKTEDLDSVLISKYKAGTIDNLITFNPFLNELKVNTKLKNTIFSSESFPGLIIETIVINKTIKDYDKKAELLREAWNITAELMNKKTGSQYAQFVRTFADNINSDDRTTRKILDENKAFTLELGLAFYEKDMAKLQEKAYKIALENKFIKTSKPIAFNISGYMGGDLTIDPNVKYFIK